MSEKRERSFSGSEQYVASPELMQSVNIAMALEKPLLIKGEPGTGKTMLAQAIASSLGKRLVIWNIKSTTKAQDGLYVYDVVQRLYDSQFGSAGVDDIAKYIKLGKLGEAFSAEEQVVLLIDEIDKADLEFPNDLLWELDQMEFYIPETQETVKAKQRQNAAADKNMGEFMEIQGLLDKIRSTGMGGISADDPQVVEKLEAKLERLKADQKSMKAVNAYYRKHKTLEGCPVLTPEAIEKLKVSMASDWRKDPVPYPSYHLTNNNANIHRVEARIAELKNRSEFASWTFPGGEAKINEEENRLQLFFDEKPTEEQRRILKSGGFRWAPSQGAWQRQLTRNAIYAADRIDFIRPEGGGSISALQPYNQRPAPDRGDR